MQLQCSENRKERGGETLICQWVEEKEETELCNCNNTDDPLVPQRQ